MNTKTLLPSLATVLGLLLVSAGVLTTAQASQTRQDLYPYLAARLHRAGTLIQLDLSLNHRLIIERDALQRTVQNRGNSVREVELRSVSSEATPTSAVGRVVDIESHPEPDTECTGSMIVFVSFNPACTQRDCAYGFSARSNMGNFFRLAYIPTSGVNEQVDVYVRRSRARFRIPVAGQSGWCLDDPSGFVELENTDGNRLELKLQYIRESSDTEVSVENSGWVASK